MTATRPALRTVALAFALLWLTTAAAVLVAMLVDVAHHATPTGARDGSLAEAAGILATNLRLAVVALAAAGLVRLVPAWRVLFDLLLGVLFTFNAAVVGVVIAQHGPAIVHWLWHLPLEWGAFAFSAGAYLHARRALLSWSLLARCAAASAAALVLAALVESFALPL